MRFFILTTCLAAAACVGDTPVLTNGIDASSNDASPKDGAANDVVSPGDASSDACTQTCLGDAGPICTNLDTDPLNCGGCAVKCPNSRCTGGKCDRIIFVTAQNQYPGNFGGINVLDNECHKSATAAKLPGTFKAWASTSTASADSRISHSTLPYVLVDGTKVADNYAGLLAPPLQHAIDRTEMNTVLTVNDADVWTGTFVSGLTATTNCGDWQDGP